MIFKNNILLSENLAELQIFNRFFYCNKVIWKMNENKFRWDQRERG